jgi:hypothetical protein
MAIFNSYPFGSMLQWGQEHSNHSTASAKLRALGEKHWTKLKIATGLLVDPFFFSGS